jgi:hypothetical protein
VTAAVVDKPLAATALKPQQSGQQKAADDTQNDAMVTDA